MCQRERETERERERERAAGGQIAISNVAPSHVPVKEALFELLQTFVVFLIGHMLTRIDAAARRLGSC
jgi:hypothetical protein